MTSEARKQFPDLRAVTMGASYRDPVCTPLRVMVQMCDGPNYGLYQIVTTDAPLIEGQPVLIDQITGRAELERQEQPK
jgi:hypothetical protein